MPPKAVDQGARDMIIEMKALLSAHMAICENDKRVQTAAIANSITVTEKMREEFRSDFREIKEMFGTEISRTDNRFGEQQKINSGANVGMAAINARMDGKMLTIAYWIIGGLGAATIFEFLKLMKWA